MHHDLQIFKVRLRLKYEIEHFISLKNNKYNSFKKKWIFPSFAIQLSINVYTCISNLKK